MSKRTYHQYCGLATALDLLGERWTLLIVRNLLRGPKRFTDLEDGLPGIGTGLLAGRLKQLQAEGIIERATLAPPAASTVYRLTADGEALRPSLLGLVRWGLDRLGPPDETMFLDPDLIMLALEARFDPSRSDSADGIYELRIDESPFRVEIRAGALVIRAGSADSPIATVTTDAVAMAELDNGRIDLQDAIAAGRLVVAGDIQHALRFATAFGLT